MRLHRFYTPFQDLIKAKPGRRLVLDTQYSEAHKTDYKALLHQWKDVFGYMAGSQVLLFDGKGTEVLAIIEEIGWAHAELVVLKKRKEAAESSQQEALVGVLEEGDTLGAEKLAGTWLFAGIIKGDHFEWIIQKTTELGIDHIVPIISDRTIKKNINMERAKKIVIEASEQCGRATIPEIYKPLALGEALENFVKAGGNLYICAEKGKKWAEIFKDGASGRSDGSAIGFAIGPEGGWSERELTYFKRKGFATISLGENVLRAETAAVAVMALLKIN